MTMPKYKQETYFDENGFIGCFRASGLDELKRTIPPEGWIDGGDSRQRMGMYHFGLEASRKLIPGFDSTLWYNSNRIDYINITSLMEISPGILCRNNDPDFWYSGPGVNSRDQDRPNKAAQSVMGLTTSLRKSFWHHLTRRGLAFMTNTRRNGSTVENHGTQYHSGPALNWWQKFVLKYKIPVFDMPDGYRNFNWKIPDFTGPGYLSYYARGFNSFFFSWLRYLGDLDFLFGSLMYKHYGPKKFDPVTKVGEKDILNHVIDCLHSHTVKPTFIINYANKHVNNADDMIARMEHYYRGSHNPSFITDLYRPLMRKVFLG